MTSVVNESCIRCKIMDCVEVCPVDCFYEGENMLVTHPDAPLGPPKERLRKAFIRKWRPKCRAATSNSIERLHEEFKRRIKTQTVLPCAETAAMLFWALLASGQIAMRKVDGWQTLAEKPNDQIIDLAA